MPGERRALRSLIGELRYACEAHYGYPEEVAAEYHEPFFMSGPCMSISLPALALVLARQGFHMTHAEVRRYLPVIAKDLSYCFFDSDNDCLSFVDSDA